MKGQQTLPPPPPECMGGRVRRPRQSSLPEALARAKSHSPFRQRRTRSSFAMDGIPRALASPMSLTPQQNRKTSRGLGLKNKFRSKKKSTGDVPNEVHVAELGNLDAIKRQYKSNSLPRTFSIMDPKQIRSERIGGGTIDSKASLLKHILSDASGIKALQQVLNTNEHIRHALAIAHNDGEIAHALSTRTSPKGMELEPRDRLEILLTRQGNQICADCTSNETSWASSNLGVFLCVQCAGVHRSLGTHISTVLSCVLDDWDHLQVDFMETWGNELANECWEFHVPSDWRKPLAEDDRDYRASYIEAKYDKKLFAQRSRKPAKVIESAPSSQSKAEQVGMIKFVGLVNITLIQGESFIRTSNHRHKKHPEIYCTLRLGQQEVRSKKIKSYNPVWNEQLMLCWDGESLLQLSVYGDEACFGVASANLMKLLQESAFPMDKSPQQAHRQVDTSQSQPSPASEEENALDRSAYSLSSDSTGHGGKCRSFLPETADSGEIWLLLEENNDPKRFGQDYMLIDSPIVVAKKGTSSKSKSKSRPHGSKMFWSTHNHQSNCDPNFREKDKVKEKGSIQLRIHFSRLDS
mmetsp:Transcript_22529/g.29243  ORF Transcript_22529/g.29243 Transcript_22529/m.29243 type:complete len:579 (+) Transcript_22529:578-2314(+)